MKLLFTTQALDLDDPVLSAYHGWVEEMAKHVEHLEVICLYEGRHELPANVSVHSLGKESLSARLGIFRRLVYTIRFKKLAWKLRKKYDAVFVHMNREYVLIGGPLWKFLRKPVYFWSNHYAGSWLTDVAAAFCTKIFCTSQQSYTAKYAKTRFMPVGVDTRRFTPESQTPRKQNSILFFSRMAPSKDPLMLVEALRLLKAKDIPFVASFVGSPFPENEAFYRSLISRTEHYGLSDCVTFVPGVPNREAPDWYRSHEIFVNCSPSGMFDKTLFEASASGCLVLARSQDWAGLVPSECSFAGSVDDLACSLETVLGLPEVRRREIQQTLITIASANSLAALMEDLSRELY